MNNNLTIFCDIDGCLLYQEKDFIQGIKNPSKCLALEETANTLLDWHNKGYKIILVTGRTENLREQTEAALLKEGILYDKLIMGMGAGPRVLINDIDPKHPQVNKAIAINLKRNEGIKDLKL
jgi:acid phosphatase class B